MRGSLSSLRAHYTREEPRGEYTLVIAGAQDTSRPESEMEPAEKERLAHKRLRALLGEGQSTRDAATQVVGELGISRRDAYRLALDVAAESAEE